MVSQGRGHKNESDIAAGRGRCERFMLSDHDALSVDCVLQDANLTAALSRWRAIRIRRMCSQPHCGVSETSKDAVIVALIAIVIRIRTFQTKSLFSVDVSEVIPAGPARQSLDSTGFVDLERFIGDDSLDPEQFTDLVVVCMPQMDSGPCTTQTAYISNFTITVFLAPKVLSKQRRQRSHHQQPTVRRP
eukprot:SAG31_NODE_285_length_18479_cov_9.871980_15_plen_189_part_00